MLPVKIVSSSVEIGSVFNPRSKAKITTDWVDEPPPPEHVRLKVLFPAALNGTVSDPEVDFDPSHAPDAEHELELDEDQVIVIESPVDPEVISDDMDTDGGGVVGGGGVEPPPPPPPPPPPQAETKMTDNNALYILFINPVYDK